MFASRCPIRALTALVCSWAGGVLLVFAPGCASGGSAQSIAPWTILCLELNDPAQASQIDELATVLKRTPGVRAGDVFTVHRGDGSAALYYGRYHRRVDLSTKKKSFPPQMRADLSLLRELGDDSNRRLFFQALPSRTPVPDVGFQDWALKNATGLYTLQVASFEPLDDFMEFKQAAAEYCRLLRERGYEAYFHHTDSGSAVTVGAFGDKAVYTDVNGRRVFGRQITDLQQDKLLQHNTVNGAIVRVRDSSGQFFAVPSRLVEIPRPGE